MMRDHPFYRLIAGGFMLFCAFVAAVFTILTDESLIGGGSGDVHLSWEIVEQPCNLLTGMYGGVTAWAVIGAWLVFCTYMMLSAIEHFHHERGLKSVIYILVTIDSIANFLYFHILPGLYQVLLTGLLYLFLVYGGKKGLSIFMSGLIEVLNARKAARYATEEEE